MANFHDQSQWPEFLAEFTHRNKTRRARFERFDYRSVEEEEQEAHLENITVEFEGEDAPRVIITRLDNSTTKPQKIVTTIPNVKWITPRFDTDDSEDGLELESKERVLILLRMESLVDGAS